MGINVVVGNYPHYICICALWFGIHSLPVGRPGLTPTHHVLFSLEPISLIVETIVLAL